MMRLFRRYRRRLLRALRLIPMPLPVSGGALTVSVLERWVAGSLDVCLAKITFDNNYPAGGLAFGPSDVGFGSIIAVLPGVAAADAGTVANVVKWDRTNGKLQLFETGAATSGDLAEQNTADQSAKICFVLVFGRRKN
jgi:hypothetical protein